ncbi:hypothetical protein GGI05_007748, partial [Coemansia sp. RSA 2603]
MPSRIPQPLSSFGRPASARSSGIPRPPNIRGRTPSPAPSHPSPQPQTGTDSNGGNNVFVRLARRLNSARSTGAVSPPPSASQTHSQSQQQQQQQQQQNQQHQNHQAVLGTVPRKMNMLLPAAAQYMSQHPRRPAMSQVQVFHTKPSSDDSTGRRAAAPARRHSYQPSGDPQQAQQAEDEEDDDDYVDARRSALASTGSGERNSTLGDSAVAEAEVNTVTAGHTMSHSQRSHRSLRLRAATTSQMPPQPPAAIERRISAASRASNIIPTITRRLGLGFGFRSTVSRNASNSSRASTSASA